MAELSSPDDLEDIVKEKEDAPNPEPPKTFITGRYVVNALTGIWNSYGCIPETGNSVSLELQDSNLSDHSLKDIVKFDIAEKDIGRIASSKEISELVVLLPMSKTYFPDIVSYDPGFVELVDPCNPCPEDPCETNTSYRTPVREITPRVYYSVTEGAWLFRIRESIINKILDVEDYKQLTIFEIASLLEHKKYLNDSNNIVKLMKMMVKYNFPPHLNWLLDKNIPPTIIYVSEFKDSFDKEDLANIWQGAMSKNSIDASEDSASVEHFFTQEEMFSDFKMDELLKNNIKLKVFKVKFRGQADYYNNVVADFRPTRWLLSKKWYRSNWPYDNFSLIELLRLDFGGISDVTANLDEQLGVLIPAEPDASGWTANSNFWKSPNARYGIWGASEDAFSPEGRIYSAGNVFDKRNY